MRKVLVVIDMQNDFIDGALGTEEAQAMLPQLEAKLAREEALLVFTRRTRTVRTTLRRRRERIFRCLTASSRRRAGRLRLR